jgi:hypothetical protein
MKNLNVILVFNRKSRILLQNQQKRTMMEFVNELLNRILLDIMNIHL